MAGETTREALDEWPRGSLQEAAYALAYGWHGDQDCVCHSNLEEPCALCRVRAALSREVGTPWRPVETAPKDGTTVLVGRHMDGWGWVVGYGYHVVHAVTGGVAIKGWISKGLNDPPGELGLASPTHWMPLPVGPALDTPEEGA